MDGGKLNRLSDYSFLMARGEARWLGTLGESQPVAWNLWAFSVKLGTAHLGTDWRGGSLFGSGQGKGFQRTRTMERL